jgi:hypothetical protein
MAESNPLSHFGNFLKIVGVKQVKSELLFPENDPFYADLESKISNAKTVDEFKENVTKLIDALIDFGKRAKKEWTIKMEETFEEVKGVKKRDPAHAIQKHACEWPTSSNYSPPWVRWVGQASAFTAEAFCFDQYERLGDPRFLLEHDLKIAHSSSQMEAK